MITPHYGYGTFYEGFLDYQITPERLAGHALVLAPL
jgi:hypothetical protein